DEGDPHAVEPAAALEEREAVGQHLTGVMEVGEAVDDRDARAGREVDDALMEECARHHEVDPALEVARDVASRLALAEPDVARREMERRATELHHADLERDPGAETRLLEDHRERPAEEERMRLPGAQIRLQASGESKNVLDLGRVQVGDAEKVALHAASARSRM